MTKEDVAREDHHPLSVEGPTRVSYTFNDYRSSFIPHVLSERCDPGSAVGHFRTVHRGRNRVQR